MFGEAQCLAQSLFRLSLTVSDQQFQLQKNMFKFKILANRTETEFTTHLCVWQQVVKYAITLVVHCVNCHLCCSHSAHPRFIDGKLVIFIKSKLWEYATYEQYLRNTQ